MPALSVREKEKKDWIEARVMLTCVADELMEHCVGYGD
jgi:hypothetical protein